MLEVAQIVASRRQVDGDRGYIDWTQRELVDIVRELSGGKTLVVRDHGGPDQGWGGDDGTASFDADVVAGFNGLHLDVCKLTGQGRDYTTRTAVVRDLAERYINAGVFLEVGGEHTPWDENRELAAAACGSGANVRCVVADIGTHVWADSQIGAVRSHAVLQRQYLEAMNLGLLLKAHNMDYINRYHQYGLEGIVSMYNLAPELAAVEIDALLMVLTGSQASDVLNIAYDKGEWRRWFETGEGTWFQRARCGARYILETPEVRRLKITPGDEDFIRRRIADAIKHG